MSITDNIQANSRKLFEILQNKYVVDYFQREYKWEYKHIEQLLADLEASFNSNYQIGHDLMDIGNYNSYYLGPIVICQKTNIRSIVDGQQRLTSITLLLIYLNNLQRGINDPEDISSLIHSKKGGRRSYNIEVPDRTHILEALYNNEEFNIDEEKDESVKNMYERYYDIENIFSDELKERLPLFIEWLKEKVVFVEILAFSDENAYTIFETMNDRGLNLTPTEMLKGYLLTHLKEPEKIDELNTLWKEKISELHRFSPQEDLEFIRAWLRSQYAESIRSASRGAENEDFEKIGTRFHTWVKDNHKRIGLTTNNAYYYFIKGDFEFYATLYEKIKDAEENFTPKLERLYLSSFWAIASSLSYPLLMAPINKLDDEETINEKLKSVATFLDILVVTRAINYKGNAQSFLRYIIYTLVKEIRNKNLDELKLILRDRLSSSKENFGELSNFRYEPSNRKFIHYLIARCIFSIERDFYNNKVIEMGELMAARRYNRFVLTPIVSGYNNYKGQFDSEDSFENVEKLLGNFLLIPNPLSQDFISDHKPTKINKLKAEYRFTSAITRKFQEENNTGYLIEKGFTHFSDFNIGILDRTNAMNNVIKDIWNINTI